MSAAVGLAVDTSEFRARFERAQRQIHGEIMSALERTVRLAAQYAKIPSGTYQGQSAVYVSRTGQLRSSISTYVIGGLSGDYVGSVVANAKQARFMEFGTKAHPITARRKSFLRFQVAGVTMFRRSIMHPGTKARPFMRAAQERTIPFFEGLVAEAFVRAFL